MGNFDSDEVQNFFWFIPIGQITDPRLYTPFTSFCSISFLLKEIKV